MALSAKKTTLILGLIAITSASVVAWEIVRINQIRQFNHAVTNSLAPTTDKESYEAKFAVAYWQAKNGKYQEATLLFSKLKDMGSDTQKSAVLYNTGNIYLLRGLAINGRDMTVRDQTEYLLTQAKTAYQASLRLDNNFWDARHNLDRVISMLPATPTPGVGDSDSPGLIMGSIPVGLP
jgi:tetratricopeptide (TPR) repeat protein